MAHIEIREARPEDRDPILAFCTNTWDWGDYIEYVWDDWLHDPQGRLYVATADGKPVGVSHFRMLNATDAWLEGIRVDPAFRQHGIAKTLNETMLADAMRRGATNARLITEATNSASIGLSERSLLHEVGSFVAFTAPAMALPRQHFGVETPVLATEADLEEIIAYLDVSSIFPATGGLFYQGFTAYRISDTLLKAKIAARQIYILRRWDRLDGLAICDTREGRMGRQFFIGYIDGTTEAISLVAYTLRQQAADMGLEQVRAHIPDLIMVRDAFTGAGYDSDGKVFLTFERSLV